MAASRHGSVASAAAPSTLRSVLPENVEIRSPEVEWLDGVGRTSGELPTRSGDHQGFAARGSFWRLCPPGTG